MKRKMLDSMIPQEYVTEEDLVNKASMALADLTKCAAVVANATPKVLAYLKGRGNTYRKENVRYFDDNVQRLY